MPITKEDILQRLNDAGYEALIVGGYVRDSILGVVTNDADLATNATPEESKALFWDCSIVETGKQFLVLRIDGIELATFRGESYLVRGKPMVHRVESFNEDASRRDFTINAMGINRNGELFDPFSGREDLKHKLIRAVGDPSERFNEDPVRLLRAVSLAVRLGFEIEAQTIQAMKSHAELLKLLPVERVVIEVSKLMQRSLLSVGLKLYLEYGFLEYIFPELNRLQGVIQGQPHHHLCVWEHSLQVLRHIERQSIQEPVLVWAALYHDCGKQNSIAYSEKPSCVFSESGHEAVGAAIFKQVETNLKLSNEVIKKASVLIRWHTLRDIKQPSDALLFLRHLAAKHRGKTEFEETVHRLLILGEADCEAKNPELSSEHFEDFRHQKNLLETALIRLDFYLKDAGITMADIEDKVKKREINTKLQQILQERQNTELMRWLCELEARDG
jgi:tRNA nucleotidyltransferase (CCA-adding enzyme)